MTDTMSVVMPDGTRLDGIPVGTSKADIMAKYQASQPSYASTVASNILPSAGNFVSNMAQPFLHPIDTATNLGHLALGTAEKLIPGPQLGDEKYPNAVGRYFANRYGSAQALSNTFASDPVGVLADAAVPLTLGGGLAARAPGVVGELGDIAATAGRIADPVATVADTARAVPAVARAVTRTGRVGEITPQAETAINAGYRIPPTSATPNPSAFSTMASAIGGKVKTSQAASEINQGVTNKLAAADLGLPANTDLSPSVLKGVRAKAGSAYKDITDALPTVTADPRFSPGFADAVKNIGVVSPDVESVLPSIGDDSRIKNLQGDLSNFVQKPTQSVLNTVRQLRANATSSMRSQDPATVAYGLAQRKAADALDGLIEDNLAASGQEDLATKYRAARQLIAKSHDVELATNPATGDVNASVLGRLANKGKPLSGNLQTIANTFLAFPRATQMPSKFGGVEPLSVLDVGAGLINPKVGAMIVSRPLARSTILSPAYQRAMLNSKLPIPPLNLPAAPRLPSLAAPALSQYPGLFGSQAPQPSY